MSQLSTVALIVAAGRGTRAPAASTPKQYRLLGGKPVLRWSLDAFSRHKAIDSIQVVIAEADRQHYDEAAMGLSLPPPVIGGATRQDSVAKGLEALAHRKPKNILIHDGARPFLSHALIDHVTAALGPASAVAPLLPVCDTIWRKNASVFERVSRNELRRAQTPQGFDFESILAAHRQHRDVAVTDDMALAQLAGLEIAEVAGEEINMKLTNAEDFELAAHIGSGFQGEIRSGTGFDVHKFTSGDHVWLCGVRVAHKYGLAGHSDADVGLHALTDSILGAVCEGDIGLHFPPSDPQWRDSSSHLFLQKAASIVRDKGGVITHVDVTLICEQPKITPHRDAMRAKIAEILDIDLDSVSVKATTTEGLGAIGRGEGIAAQAIATIRLPGGTQ